MALKIQISGPPEQPVRYIHRIEAEGGTAVPGYCPPPDPACAGLLLCGGGDLDPTLFGQENLASEPPDRARDRAELTLVQTYLVWRRPVLGICRGLQVLNVVLGGTLFQDLGERVSVHRGERDVYHAVRTVPGTVLAGLYGPKTVVNSAHHQGVDRLGKGLTASAWSEDGVLEGLEHTALPVVGVQFHPERLDPALGGGNTAEGAALFRWFLARCGAG